MAADVTPEHRVTDGPAAAIRPVAAAVIRDGDRLLVWEDHDPATGDVVSVPLAGGIEFGETGAEAIARELREELGQVPSAVSFLGLFEDIFEWNGQRRHELWLAYAVGRLDEVVVHEDDGTSYLARWRRIDDLRGPERRLVPEGLLGLVQGG